MEPDAEWILPENLRKQEAREQLEVEGGLFTGQGDFGSYYSYRKKINCQFIETHAQVDDSWAKAYAQSLKLYLESHGIRLSGNVLDVGCAIGTITNALHNINFNGETTGLDISNDAIAVAKEKYPLCCFHKHSADDLSTFPDHYFDLIHAREFYPFTRTSDRNYQLQYLRSFYQKLKKNGAVILQMVCLERGFCHSFKELAQPLRQVGYSFLQQDMMISLKLFKIFGCSIYRRVPIYQSFFSPLNQLLVRARGGNVGYYYLLKKT